MQTVDDLKNMLAGLPDDAEVAGLCNTCHHGSSDIAIWYDGIYVHICINAAPKDFKDFMKKELCGK